MSVEKTLHLQVIYIQGYFVPVERQVKDSGDNLNKVKNMNILVTLMQRATQTYQTLLCVTGAEWNQWKLNSLVTCNCRKTHIV